MNSEELINVLKIPYSTLKAKLNGRLKNNTNFRYV